MAMPPLRNAPHKHAVRSVNSVSLRIVFVLALGFGVAEAQDLQPYFRMVEEGKTKRVRDEITRLLEQYPNHPGVIFLGAVTQDRAENAIITYKQLIQDFPDSPYADDAMMKVGEYLFARGLYTQSSRELARVPKKYPRSEHVQRAIDLQINSLLATGERDSVDYYVRLYRSRFPGLDFEYNLDSDKPLVNRPLTASTPSGLSEGMRQPSVSSLNALPKTRPTPTPRVEEDTQPPEEKVSPSVPKPFVIQVGAYGSKDNALRQKMRLEQMGYDVDLVPITSRGKTLQAVQIIRFATRGEAARVGEKLKSDLGFGYIVLRRPEK